MSKGNPRFDTKPSRGTAKNKSEMTTKVAYFKRFSLIAEMITHFSGFGHLPPGSVLFQWVQISFCSNFFLDISIRFS
jgi:hypothetical protein